jgi:hypothetical protein
LFNLMSEPWEVTVTKSNYSNLRGITPWLKVAHLAEAFNTIVVPTSATEVHAGLCCAVPNAPYLEYSTQLASFSRIPVAVEYGSILPPTNPGVGLELDLGLVAQSNVLGIILEYPPSKAPPAVPKAEPTAAPVAKAEEPKMEEPKHEEMKKEEMKKEEPKEKEHKKKDKKEKKEKEEAKKEEHH